MAYFDYSPVEGPRYGLGSLVGLGIDLYGKYRDRKHQEDQAALAEKRANIEQARQAASQKFTEAQSAAEQKRLDLAANQQGILFKQHQADRAQGVVTGVGKAFGAGRFGEAKALAAASQFPDAQGNMQGVGLRQLPNEMPAPGEAPKPPQAPEFVGPLETPAMANARAPAGPVTDLSDPGAEVQRQQALRDKFGADTASLPQRQAEHAKATQAFQEGERNPGFELSFPSGQKVTMNGREQQLAAQADSKEKAQALLHSFGPNTPPEVLRAVAIQAGLIGAGVSNADKAPITNSNAGLQAQAGRVDLANVNNKAAAERARAKAAAKGLGFGGGAKLNGAAEELSNLIQKGIDSGQPLTYPQKVRAANQLGVPIDSKAGHTSLKSIDERFISEAKAPLPGERLTERGVESWAAKNDVGKIQRQQRELEGLQKEIADNAHNPLLQALAIEKAVSAARGGAASKQALALALEHLGGSLDNSGAIISKIRSGEIGPKQMENFNGFIRGQLGNAQKEGKTAYESYNAFMAAQPAAKQNQLIADRARLFSGMHGFGGKSEGGGAAPSAKGGPAANSKLALAQEALADPEAPPDVKQRAQAIVDAAK